MNSNTINVSAHIGEMWKSGGNKDCDVTLTETMRLLVGEIDSILNAGLGAFQDLDATTRQLAQSRELVETRSREAQRLQSADEESRDTLSVSEITKIYILILYQ
jgi:hypothetical protein